MQTKIMARLAATVLSLLLLVKIVPVQSYAAQPPEFENNEIVAVAEEATSTAETDGLAPLADSTLTFDGVPEAGITFHAPSQVLPDNGAAWEITWHTGDAAAVDLKASWNSVSSGGDLTSYGYRPADADMGKKLFLTATDGIDTFTAVSAPVVKGTYTEQFDVLFSELAVGMSLDSSAVAWGIQGFHSRNATNLYPNANNDYNTISYQLNWMLAKDATSVGFPVATMTDVAAGLKFPNYTLQPEDAGKYLYLRLQVTPRSTGLGTRKAEYVSNRIGPVILDEKLPLNPISIRRAGTNLSGLSAIWDTDDARIATLTDLGYSYEVRRVTGTGANDYVVVKTGTVDKPTTGGGALAPPRYGFTDEDIGSTLYLAFTAKDAVTGLSYHYSTVPSPEVLPRRLTFSYNNHMLGDFIGVGSGSSDYDIYITKAAGSTVAYEYYLTDTPDAAAAKTIAKSGATTLSNGQNVSTFTPTYRPRIDDIGRYLHLTLTVDGHPYTISLGDPIVEAPLTLEGTPYQQQAIKVSGYTVYVDNAEDVLRYEWRRNTGTNLDEGTDVLLNGGIAEGTIPGHRVGTADVDGYIYFKLITQQGSEFTSNLVGPVVNDVEKASFAISGETTVDQILSATLVDRDGVDFTGRADITINWFVDDGAYGSYFASGWEVTIPDRYMAGREYLPMAGERIYATASGAGMSDYDGPTTSPLTDPIVQYNLTPEKTGVTGIQTTLTNTTPIGFITDTASPDFGSREDITADITILGVEAMPAASGFTLAYNDGTAEGIVVGELADTGTAAGGNVTYKVIFKGVPHLPAGNDTVYIGLAKLDVNVPTLWYEIDPNPVTVEMLLPLEVTVENAHDGVVEIVQGSTSPLYVTTNAENATQFHYSDISGNGITIDTQGVMTAATSATNATLVITAVDATARRAGTLILDIKTRYNAVDASGLMIYTSVWNEEEDRDDKFSGDALLGMLEGLSAGFSSDPGKTGYALISNTLQLKTAPFPSGALLNYAVDWSSNAEDIATVDKNGTVRVVGAGQVSITATIRGSAPAVKATVTFTAATSRYTPQSIVHSASAIKIVEREGRQLTNLKVKCLVDGKGSTALKAPQSAYSTLFSFFMEDPTVATVDENGYIAGLKKGDTTLRITMKNLPNVEVAPIAITVDEANYASLSFTVSGRSVTAMADGKGVLKGNLVLFDGTDISGKKSFSLNAAVAGIASNFEEGLLDRNVSLTGVLLKISKYTANTTKAYTLTLPNGQKLVLDVTVANTVPSFMNVSPLYNNLEAKAVAQFKVWGGTHIKDVVLPDESKIEYVSWAQDGEYVSVWIKAAEGTPAKKNIATAFQFTTNDLAGGSDKTHTVNTKITIASLPKASMSTVYLNGAAFALKGYALNNASEMVGRVTNYDQNPDFTETMERYDYGFLTVYKDITGSKNNIFGIRNGKLVLKDNVTPEEIPSGRFTYDLTYYYQAVDSGKTSLPTTTKLVINITPFAIKQKMLDVQVKAGTISGSTTPTVNSIDFTLHSRYSVGVSKADAKKGYIDGRFQFQSSSARLDSHYELVWAESGIPVTGVNIITNLIGTDAKLGKYRKLTLQITGESELLKEGKTTYPAGTFKLLMHTYGDTAYATASNPVSLEFTPVLRIDTTSPTIKLGKVSAFNQTAFSEQQTTVTYTTNTKNLGTAALYAVMEKAPQPEDPFTFAGSNGAFTIFATPGSGKTPAVGTYQYTCVLISNGGVESKPFTLKINVTKAVGQVVVSAKIAGSINPYGRSWYDSKNKFSAPGYAQIQFSSNVPNLPLAVTDISIMETHKNANAAIEEIDVYNQKITTETFSNNTLYLCSMPSSRAVSNIYNYVPTDVTLSVGTALKVTFKQMKALPIKEKQNDKDYGGDTWNLAKSPNGQRIKLRTNDSYTVSTAESPSAYAAIYGEDYPETLYRLVNGNYVQVNSSEAADIEGITLTGNAAKNFEIVRNDSGYDYGSNHVTLRPITDAGRKTGKTTLTYSVIPSVSATTVQRQVTDLDGNPLYQLIEDSEGKESYSKYTVSIPKPITMKQTVELYYDYVLPPALK
ncbi:Ig-like domain-containing protein [Ruminococcaceae bacterium OttesenSCG-928-A11]|nr:Ig-like domain-containing protein [Ruminococcaceae bacterium OttesenSCG-928-A11]